MSKKGSAGLRVKYLRLLERFVYSISRTLAKSTDLTREAFDKKVDRSYKNLSNCEEVELYKSEPQKLQECASKILQYRHSSKSIDEIKEAILRDVNLYEKECSSRRYKKDKHKKPLNEWE